MDSSVTEFRAHCLELIRQVEAGGETVDIKRHGKLVARLTPPPFGPATIRHPWEALRNSGALLADPEESVLAAQAFDALQ